jgi:hypothetical protein
MLTVVVLNAIIMSVVIVSVLMVSVVMLSVVMVSVLAPLAHYTNICNLIVKIIGPYVYMGLNFILKSL